MREVRLKHKLEIDTSPRENCLLSDPEPEGKTFHGPSWSYEIRSINFELEPCVGNPNPLCDIMSLIHKDPKLWDAFSKR